jgi:hypothetical protein
MHPLLRAHAALQNGAFTRAQTREAGYSERQLKTLLRPGGEWAVLRRGVYAERGYVDGLDATGRYLLGVHAVTLSTRPGNAVSHTSAAAVHGMPLRGHWLDLHHITRPGTLGGRTESGLTHHRARLEELDLTERHGFLVTSMARTAVDIARLHGFEDGVVAADAALRLGATRAELATMLERCRCWPHNTQARQAVRVADAGAESIGETLTRPLVLELDIGVPETQFRVSDGRRTAYVDLRVGRHLFEFDGQVKYRGRASGGVADRPIEDVLWDEKRREDWLRSVDGGFGLSRVIWADLFGPARARAKQRLAAEHAATVKRFGRSA